MTEFQGIPIDEGVLSDTLTFYSILFSVFIVVSGILLLVLRRLSKPNPEQIAEQEKKKALLHHLQKHAEKEPSICRRIEELEKDTARVRCDRYAVPLLLVVIAFVVIAGFLFAWLPCYQDMAHKDYEIIHTSFELEYQYSNRSGNRCWIVLPDGKSLNVEDSINDIIPAEEGTYTGTIVYTPRSELVLGIEWEDVS